ncbi:MAG: transglutaminase domain-containing protein, partial [Eubacterium sp.]
MNYMEALKTNLPEDVALLKARGDFETAQKLIDKWLTRKISKAMTDRLTLEKVILNELPIQYPFNFDTALKMMQEKVDGFTAEDLNNLKD